MKKSIVLSCTICTSIIILFICTPSMHEIPFPRGIFGIGFTTEYFIDQKRLNNFLNNKKNRELLVSIWYPTDQRLSCSYPYGNQKLLTKQIEQDHSLLGGILYAKQLLGLSPLATCSHSNPNMPPLSISKSQYPIIIFSPGSGAPSFIYSSLIEDLASSGFIIIGMNHTPYNGVTLLPSGTIINGIDPSLLHTDIDWNVALNIATQDITFLIDQLTMLNENSTSNWYKKFDLDKIGMIGHSFGGAVTVNACRNDTRIKAGIDLDGWLGDRKNYTGFKQPFLFILSDHNHPTKTIFMENLNDIRTTSGNSTPPATLIQIPNSYHLSFCDFTLFKFPLNTIIPIEWGNTYLNIERMRNIISQFFYIHIIKPNNINDSHVQQ